MGNCCLIATVFYKCSGNFTEDITYSKMRFFYSLGKCFPHAEPRLLLLLMASRVPVLVPNLYSYYHYTILKVQTRSRPTHSKNSRVQGFDFSHLWASGYFCILSCAYCAESSHHRCLCNIAENTPLLEKIRHYNCPVNPYGILEMNAKVSYYFYRTPFDYPF